jgi:hypothetical protein
LLHPAFALRLVTPAHMPFVWAQVKTQLRHSFCHIHLWQVPVRLAESIRRDCGVPTQHGKTRPVIPALLQEFVDRLVPMSVATALERSKRGELQRAILAPSMKKTCMRHTRRHGPPRELFLVAIFWKICHVGTDCPPLHRQS